MTGSGRQAPGRRSRLRPGDVLGLARQGLGGRPLRTVLSAAGVALGVATMVSVLGISSSSRAQLLAQIDALGTNLLAVTPGQAFSGQNVTLPKQATAMIAGIGPVQSASAIADVNAHVYRNDRISAANTNAITVYAAQPTLLRTLRGRLVSGRFLTGATEHLSAVVLGAGAASALGVDRSDGSVQLWLGNRRFSVVGILEPLQLAPELDRAALIGLPVAQSLFRADASPAEIYLRADPTNVNAVRSVLAATAYPAAPQDVAIANPSDALTARAAASAAFESLFLGLGAVALLVGGVGIANVMVIAVLERRNEIGLRRAIGAKRRHISMQFMAEAALLSLLGGAAGAALGGATAAVYASLRHWSAVVPLPALAAAVCAALAVGAVAGLYPAVTAAHLAPSEALRAN